MPHLVPCAIPDSIHFASLQLLSNSINIYIYIFFSGTEGSRVFPSDPRASYRLFGRNGCFFIFINPIGSGKGKGGFVARGYLRYLDDRIRGHGGGGGVLM